MASAKAIACSPRCGHPVTSDCNSKGESSYVCFILICCTLHQLILGPKDAGPLSSVFDPTMMHEGWHIYPGPVFVRLSAGLFGPIDVEEFNGESGVGDSW